MSGMDINQDTTALKHKNVFHENGPMGDQDLKQSTQNFNSAVSTAFNIIGLATALKTLIPNNEPRNTQTNYWLTDVEKEFLKKKAAEFASYGVTPYDVLEDFLFVLVAIDNYDDLKYVSDVTNIPELADENLVRAPIPILSLKELYKIGYLANGLAALTKQFSTSFQQARSTADSEGSAFGALLGAAAFAASPAGSLSNVLGPLAAAQALGFSGTSAIEAAAGFALAGSISQFPGVNIVNDVVGDMVSQIGITSGISALLSNPMTGTSSKISQLPAITAQLSSLQSTVLNTSTIIANQGINSLAPIAGQLFTLQKKIKNTVDHSTQISAVASVASTSAKAGDLDKQMGKIDNKVTEISTELAGIVSQIGAIKGPGNIGPAAGMLMQTGGRAASSIITELTMGQRIPPSVICNNPLMQPPSFAGRAFFGEGSSSRMSVDQMFSRRIATYPSSPAGSGLQSFQMQNFASLGGSISLTSMISRITIGVAIPPVSGALASMIGAKTSEVASLLGVAATALIEPRRSDNAIPFQIATSAGLINDTRSPFSTNVFSSGWKIASSVGNDLQRIAPNFLATARSSL
ncbi:hypothetical protein UFOVP247_100 [uncultured Caudovirales phage]|uniref:Uncharacterized protein n=1 Tax=uncultured Caudovirales phage TaxID=2100421 RepID=A0A6J7WWG1_9CAUD|nr:hypothetical protein UFOVP247_100 [uncultured Caudovirales phage]